MNLKLDEMPIDLNLLNDMSNAERKELAALLAAMSPAQVFRGKYLRNPAGFVRDCFVWKPGECASGYQLEICGQLIPHKRVSVRGPHGLGKTSMAAWVILWFALTRDAGGDDWKIPTTASAWRQLTKFLWPEVHKWAQRLKWDIIGREPFSERDEIFSQSMKLNHGEAFALASDNAAMIEGAHADEILYVFDEAKEIKQETWDAAEGAFSTGNAYALAISTPGEPTGRFYEIHKRAPGYEDWWVRHVTKEEAIKAGRMSQDWSEAKARQWGESSAIFQNRVVGEFASSSEDTVISLASVERSNQRWLARNDVNDWGPLTVVGLDVGRGGDLSVFARRHGNAIRELERNHSADLMQIVGVLVGILRGNKGAKAMVDVLGIGAGVVDRAREIRDVGARVIAFVAGGKTELTDEAGEMGFVNCRSAGWWNLRILLNNDEIDLPPDDNLTGDLTSCHWKAISGGKIQVESKDDIKKRLGRSTDDGDAVMQAFFSDRSATDDEIQRYKDNVLVEETVGADLLAFLKDSGIDLSQFTGSK